MPKVREQTWKAIKGWVKDESKYDSVVFWKHNDSSYLAHLATYYDIFGRVTRTNYILYPDKHINNSDWSVIMSQKYKNIPWNFIEKKKKKQTTLLPPLKAFQICQAFMEILLWIWDDRRKKKLTDIPPYKLLNTTKGGDIPLLMCWTSNNSATTATSSYSAITLCILSFLYGSIAWT